MSVAEEDGEEKNAGSVGWTKPSETPRADKPHRTRALGTPPALPLDSAEHHEAGHLQSTRKSPGCGVTQVMGCGIRNPGQMCLHAGSPTDTRVTSEQCSRQEGARRPEASGLPEDGPGESLKQNEKESWLLSIRICRCQQKKSTHANLLSVAMEVTQSWGRLCPELCLGGQGWGLSGSPCRDSGPRIGEWGGVGSHTSTQEDESHQLPPAQTCLSNAHIIPNNLYPKSKLQPIGERCFLLQLSFLQQEWVCPSSPLPPPSPPVSLPPSFSLSLSAVSRRSLSRMRLFIAHSLILDSQNPLWTVQHAEGRFSYFIFLKR